jgi:hypothetical protein
VLLLYVVTSELTDRNTSRSVSSEVTTYDSNTSASVSSEVTTYNNNMTGYVSSEVTN